MKTATLSKLDKAIAQAEARGLIRKVTRVNVAAIPKGKKSKLVGTVTPAVDMAKLIIAVEHAGFPRPKPEHKFHPDRKWAFDLCWVDGFKVAFEREGGIWRRIPCKCGKSLNVYISRHRSPEGYEKDLDKYNAAASMGYLIVRGTARSIQDGRAAKQLIDVLTFRKQNPPR